MTRVAITVISFPKVESSCEVAIFPFLAPRPNRVMKWSWHVVARIGERKKHFLRYNQVRNRTPMEAETNLHALACVACTDHSGRGIVVCGWRCGPSRLFREKPVTALKVSDICASDARQVAT